MTTSHETRWVNAVSPAVVLLLSLLWTGCPHSPETQEWPPRSKAAVVLPTREARALTRLDLMHTPRQFAAADLYHETGEELQLATAFSGRAWRAQVGRDRVDKLMCLGPYATDIPPGANQATFRLRCANPAPGDIVAVLEIENPQGRDPLTTRNVMGNEFAGVAANAFKEFTINYNHGGRGGLNYNVKWTGKATVDVDLITTRFTQPPKPVPSIPAGQFHLRDGDRVVWFGDSVTELGAYHRLVEEFARVKFPERRIYYGNAGLSGDTAPGGLARLDDDVMVHNPTVVLVNFGLNDSGYDTWADGWAERAQRYRDAMAQIIERLRYYGVRVYLMTPYTTDYVRRPDFAAADVNQPLRQFAVIQNELATAYGLTKPADWGLVCEAVRNLEKPSNPNFYFAADAVHPDERGHLLAASVILQMWAAPFVTTNIALQPLTSPPPGSPHGTPPPVQAFNVPVWWLPEGLRPDWQGSHWFRVIVTLSGGLSVNVRVNGGDKFLLKPGEPRDITGMPAVYNAVAAVQQQDAAIRLRDKARFDFWRRRPELIPTEPANIVLWNQYRASLETTLTARQNSLNAVPTTTTLEFRTTVPEL